MYIILACKLQCLYAQDCILIWIYRTQINYITYTDIHKLQDPLLLKTHFCVKTHVKYKLHILSPVTKSEHKE